MAARKRPRPVFAVLPYIKTSARIYIRGFVFRSSNDVADLPTYVQRHIKQLVSMLRLYGSQPLDEVTLTIFELPADMEPGTEIFARLREAHALIRYLLTVPPDMDVFPARSYEETAMYLMIPDRVPALLLYPRSYPLPANLEGKMRVPVFECVLDWNTISFRLSTKEAIYPPTPGVCAYGDLHTEIESYTKHPHNWALARLVRSNKEHWGATERRIFTALKWYNLSSSRGLDSHRSLMYLAVAFESLLGLSKGREVTERFKETVQTLLGPVPRLDVWLDQFYIARSAVVHEGAAPSLMFLIGSNQKDGGKIPYRPLVDYGLHIFRICLNTILSGAILASERKLAPALIHNQERLNEICKVLAATGKSAQEKLEAAFPIIEELSDYVIHSTEHTNIKAIVGTGRLIASIYLETSPNISPQLRNLLETIRDNPESLEDKEMIGLFKKLASLGGRWTKQQKRVLDLGSREYRVHQFFAYASNPHLMLWVHWPRGQPL